MKKKITSLAEGFEFLTMLVHKTHQTDFDMYKKGMIFPLEAAQKKFSYRLQNIYHQVNSLVENEEKEIVLEKLKKEKEVVYEKCTASFEGEKTLEKDIWKQACYASVLYCEDLIKVVEKSMQEKGTFKEEIKKTTKILTSVRLTMLGIYRKDICEVIQYKNVKEKAITPRLKKRA